MAAAPMLRSRLLGTLAALSPLCVLSCATRPAPERVLAVLAERDVEGLDPHTSGQVWQTQMVRANVYEGLVSLDEQMRLVPALASSWSTPDDVTWTFRLRHDVRFHDGSALTPGDVVSSLQRARDHPRSTVRVALAGVETIEPSGPDGVLLRTREPDAYLAPRLTEVSIASSRCLADEPAVAAGRVSCGTGPYRVAERRAGDYVDLLRHEAYRGGAAPIPRVRFVARSSGAPDSAALLPRGALLLFWARPGSPEAAAARGRFRSWSTPGLAVLYLSFDLHADGPRARPFLDARVREAAARALAGAELKAALGAASLPASQFVPAAVLGFDPDRKPPRRDLDAARRLLAATPFAGGFDVDLDLRQIHEAYGPPLAGALASVGIRARPRTFPEAEFFEHVAKGESALALLRFSCWTGDAQSFFDKVLHSKRVADGYGVFNYSYVENPLPGLDEAIDAARRELSPSRRLVLLRAVMNLALEGHIAVPVAQERQEFFASGEIAWRPRADTLVLAKDVGLASPTPP